MTPQKQPNWERGRPARNKLSATETVAFPINAQRADGP